MDIYCDPAVRESLERGLKDDCAEVIVIDISYRGENHSIGVLDYAGLDIALKLAPSGRPILLWSFETRSSL